MDALDADGRSQHDAKVEKHRDAVRRCADSDRTSFSVTDPNAALIKFPSGASQPGHRLSIGASRSDVRFVVTALVDGAPTDFGKLREVTTAVEVALLDAGLLSDDAPTMKLVADAGYTARDDLRFASEVRSRIDILVPIPKSKSAILNGQPQLGVEAFQVDGDTAICPANRTMQGPRHSKDGTVQWLGVGCAECPLKPRCTGAKRRTLAIHPETQALRQAMAERMNADGARKRYNQRIATVEPIFSYISDTMGFTRSSSRRTDTVVAEILLKLLTYNLLRLHTAATDRRYICTHARTS